MSTNEQDPEAILANYSSVKLQCRVDRHRWGRKVFYEQEGPAVARRYMTCQDCATQRWRLINTRTFEILTNWRYNYAPGYRTPGSGLTLDDFTERLYSEDYAAAVQAGRVEYREPAEEDAPTPAPALKAVPPAKKKAS